MKLKITLNIGELLRLIGGCLTFAIRLHAEGHQKEGQKLLYSLMVAFSRLRQALPEKVTLSILMNPSQLLKLIKSGKAFEEFKADLKIIRNAQWPIPWPGGDE